MWVREWVRVCVCMCGFVCECVGVGGACVGACECV